MIVGYKDIFKMVGILIVSFCAVFVCALFLNYNMDLVSVEDQLVTELAKMMYEMQRNTAILVSAVSGGCLLVTTLVLLCFYVGHYIDTHKKQLGILKALGYSRMEVSGRFGVFGLPVFAGTAAGYFCAHLMMPRMYVVQNKEGYLPDFEVTFHPSLCLALVGLPTVFFALAAVFYSYRRMNVSALALIRESMSERPPKPKKALAKKEGTDVTSDLSFLAELKKNNVRQSKALVFFIAFATFCFSAMVQMSCSMDELSSVMMSVMIMAIGIVLACVTLLIATTSIVKANSKTIMMMKVFGYGARDCSQAVLGGYRPWAYLGFALGTVYQYGLLKLAVEVIFAGMEGVPDYQFDWPVMAVTLAVFLVLYEMIMLAYTKKMEKLPLKEIMLE